MPKQTIDQIDVTARRVLMRVDFNVPLDPSGTITDDRRIVQALPSIRSVLDRGGRLVLMSHLGRPGGEGHEPALSLRPAADRLRALLGSTVHFPSNDCIDAAAVTAAEQLAGGEALVLENLRFHKEEKAGDAAFASKLAAYGDIYCNDAFGTAHREDASMVAVPNAMGGKPRVAGLLLIKELTYLGDIILEPERPFVAVLGGVKVADKLAAISNLLHRVDTVLIAGAMAYTFIKALGHEIGSSLVQLELLEKAQAIIDEAAANPVDLILPKDHVCGKQLTKITPVQVTAESIEAGWMGLDIGPETTSQYDQILRQAKTVVWNGPVGAFELQPFEVGTRQVAESIAAATAAGATTIIGGGDTAAAVHAFGLEDQFTHISTGGGASLAMLEGRQFASVGVLEDA